MHVPHRLTALLVAAPLSGMAACSVIPSADDPYRPPVYMSQRPTLEDYPRGDALLRSVMLEHHNAARREVGAAPLAWDSALARDAQAYAVELTASGRFEHASQDGGPGRQGENLWKGTQDAFSYAEMVGAWIDEDRFYISGRFPHNSNTSRWQDVAHYTQVIWPATRSVGCGLASGQGADVLVCRYSPPGNVVGVDPMGR